jgi:hypothetical protein
MARDAGRDPKDVALAYRFSQFGKSIPEKGAPALWAERLNATEAVEKTRHTTKATRCVSQP